MIDESQTIVEEVAEATPDPEATAAPEVEGSVEQDQEPDGEVAPKTFTQEEIDDIVAKRLAKAERKWRREQQAQQQPEIPVHEPAEEGEIPDPRTIIEQYEARKQEQALDEQYEEREEAALERYDDFDQVAKNPALPVTRDMALAIKASEIGPDILYHLGSNPKDAARIARLPPLLQAKEIGRIEAVLTANPPAKKISSAPAPIAPVTARNTGGPTYDTTDPRAIKQMTVSEWIEADRQRMIKRLEAQRR